MTNRVALYSCSGGTDYFSLKAKASGGTLIISIILVI